jgi:hypothetical protein
MAVRENTEALTFLAGEDFSEKQFTFVSMDAGEENTVVSTTAGAKAVGVMQNKPNFVTMFDGEVDISGRTKIKAGGTIAAGADVASGAGGVAVAAAAGDYINGTALTGAASGELVEVLLGSLGVAPA